MQQQKIAYEHEIRKQENYANQMKSRMNQLLANKNTDKKTASVISPNLPKTDRQRGKWKTESAAKSCLEEMYTSVISSYENRVKEMLKEIKEYHHCLEYIRSEMLEIISSIRINKNENHEWADSDPNGQPFSEGNFKILLSRIKEIISENVNPCVKESCEVNALDSALFSEESEKIERSEEEVKNKNFESGNEKKVLQMEPGNQKTQVHLSTDTEETVMAMEKLEVIQFAMQRKVINPWLKDFSTSIPSFAVITTKEGINAVPTAKQLEACLNAPDEVPKCLVPLDEMKSLSRTNCLSLLTENVLSITDPSTFSPFQSTENLQTENLLSVTNPSTFSSLQSTEYLHTENLLPVTNPSVFSPLQSTENMSDKFNNPELPKWAIVSASQQTPIAVDNVEENSEVHLTSNTSSYESVIDNSQDESELSLVSSTDEQNLALLRAAVHDMEQR
ncbi:Afadin- and alpha-actinin-binding protein, partial [Stegodyphus mimosarum]